MTAENWLTVEQPDDTSQCHLPQHGGSGVTLDWTSVFSTGLKLAKTFLLGEEKHRYSRCPSRPIVLQAMDAGYDVWMPNGRGTRYSLGHKTLDARADPEYWDFSFDL